MVKTRVQLEPEKFAGNGFLDNAKTLVAEEGVGVLLGGLGSTALGYSLHGSLKYAGFEWLKYAVVHHGGGVDGGSPIALFAADHRLAALMIAGMTAEFVATLALCPVVREEERGGGIKPVCLLMFCMSHPSPSLSVALRCM